MLTNHIQDLERSLVIQSHTRPVCNDPHEDVSSPKGRPAASQTGLIIFERWFFRCVCKAKDLINEKIINDTETKAILRHREALTAG